MSYFLTCVSGISSRNIIESVWKFYCSLSAIVPTYPENFMRFGCFLMKIGIWVGEWTVSSLFVLQPLSSMVSLVHSKINLHTTLTVVDPNCTGSWIIFMHGLFYNIIDIYYTCPRTFFRWTFFVLFASNTKTRRLASAWYNMKAEPMTTPRIYINFISNEI